MPLQAEPGPRGSGRTYRMIQALPRGAHVVVSSVPMRWHLRHEVARIHGVEFATTLRVHVVNTIEDVRALASLSAPFYVDHSFCEDGRLTQEVVSRIVATPVGYGHPESRPRRRPNREFAAGRFTGPEPEDL